MIPTEDINPKILTWARETAGLSVEQAADKLGLKDTARATKTEKLLAFEDGELGVTSKLLLRFATVYRRPLVSFYLTEPPKMGERGRDFRSRAANVSARENSMLDALVRDVRARQQMLREVLISEDEARPLQFVASADMEHGAKGVADLIRVWLNISVDHQRHKSNPADLFAALRTAAEGMGVYVLLLGDLGSHHSDISEEVFRGFALTDDIAPFVVINDNDAVVARAFTLMHELAHVWIGESGISGPIQGVSTNKVERFCNDVAGEFLLPEEALAGTPSIPRPDIDATLALVDQIARKWNISQGVVAYRLARSRKISEETTTQLFAIFATRWRVHRAKTKVDRDPDGGPSYYVVRRSRLGVALLDVVRRALQGDVITHTKAAKILGVSPSSVDPLLSERRPKAA
jgi:Zn-dependent peptidase ImmA (M78 family)